jgi:tRNA(adenine34) deaminase
MNYMQEAIDIAKKSGTDIPIGAIIVSEGKIIAKAHNEKEKNNDTTAHAEIVVIRETEKILGTTNLKNCELYVTLEPCPMCTWAILNAKISKVFFGAYDSLYGSLGSKFDFRKIINSKTKVFGGIMEEECATLIQNHFKKIR